MKICLSFAIFIMVCVGCSDEPIVDSRSSFLDNFKNPGGMWMPDQMQDHAEELKQLGVSIPARELADPTAYPLAAVVNLGTCSGAMVSPEGLVLTHRACLRSTLQSLSESGRNILKNGYLAKSREDELPLGGQWHAEISIEFTDVTDRVVDGLDGFTSEIDKANKIEANLSTIKKACEKEQPRLKCEIVPYYEGAQYYRIKKKAIRDVRLVHVAGQGIGNFGGVVDRWHWPRHTGDYAFVRLYVGPDQEAIEYSEKNVFFSPPYHLKPAKQPLQSGDVVLVAGYPKKTNRNPILDQLSEDIHIEIPRKVHIATHYGEILESLSEDSIYFEQRTRVLREYLKIAKLKQRGVLEGLEESHLEFKRTKLEQQLHRWMESDPQMKAKYGAPIERIRQLREEWHKHRITDTSFVEIFDRGLESEVSLWDRVNLIKAAYIIVRLAYEKEKPDSERHPDFKKANWPSLYRWQIDLQNTYHPTSERESLKFFVERATRIPPKLRPKILLALVGPQKNPDVDKMLHHFYTNTEIEDPEVRLLLMSATREKLSRTHDSMILAARKFLPDYIALEERREAFKKRLSVLKPLYLEALEQMGHSLGAPDANHTLRLSYGRVRDFQSKNRKNKSEPFSTVFGVIRKHLGLYPFEVPAKLIRAAFAEMMSSRPCVYRSSAHKDIPVNFVSDVDLGEGAWGSATLNASGELVGLTYDGNAESLSSEYQFRTEKSRAIHVDMRYVNWILDAVVGGDDLLKEMGVTPSIP